MQLKAANPFWKVETFTNRLAQNFRAHYCPGRFIDIDEMSINFKGRHKCRVYNPNKPEKFHFKAFCLNDSETGYLWDFYLYRGASEIRPPGVSASFYPIQVLTNYPEIKGKSRILALDNWYTSVEVVKYCLALGIHVVGTVRVNRKGLPRQGIFSTKKNAQARGSMQCFVKDDIYFTAWQDNKPVHLLSTWPPLRERVRRNDIDPQGRHVSLQIDRPSVIGVYNKAMGGTDKHDQLHQYYKTPLKTKKWPTRIITHLLISSVVNACIIYKDCTRDGYRVTLHDFTCMLTRQLLGIVNLPREITTAVRARPPNQFEVLGDRTLLHTPCTEVKENGHTRKGYCRACGNTSCLIKCSHCDTYMCVKGPAGKTCWHKIHLELVCRNLDMQL